MSFCKKQKENINYTLLFSFMNFSLQIFLIIRLFEITDYVNALSLDFQSNIEGTLSSFDTKIKLFVSEEKNIINKDINKNVIPFLDDKIYDIKNNIDNDIDKIFFEVNKTKNFLSKYSFLIDFINSKNITQKDLDKFFYLPDNIKYSNILLRDISLKLSNINKQLSYINSSILQTPQASISRNFLPS